MSLPFTQVNEATTDSNIYVGLSTTLDLTLTNNTGSTITVNPGNNASAFLIYLPMYFTDTELGNMDIERSGWSFQANSGELVLTYAGTDPYSWENGDDITFTITNVEASASPSTGSTQINFQNFTGSLPFSVTAALNLIKAPVEGNANLKEVLQVFLEDQGKVYVSPANDPLENTLFLNFKNIGNDPLSTNSQASNGIVQVSFVYGDTSGALAPDDGEDRSALGSAWNIEAGLELSEGNEWTITNPDLSATEAHPVWQLMPSDTNLAILDTGANANITFSFSNIVSFTPPGNTQMTVLFSGFKKDDDTDYDDAIFTLNIVKLSPPLIRGILDFYSKTPRIDISGAKDEITINLKWTMSYVDKVTLSTSFPNTDPVDILYPVPQPVAIDTTSISFSGISSSTLLTITLQAFDQNGNYLNGMQFTVFIQLIDTFTDLAGKTYPVVLIGSKLWMAANLDYETPDGNSAYYNDDAANQIPYGRYYTRDVALQNIPDGWRLPTKEDWQDLLKHYKGKALSVNGKSGFNVEYGGYYNVATNGSGEWIYVGEEGDYLSQTMAAEGYIYSLIVDDISICEIIFIDERCKLSVRYLRDAHGHSD